jgi:hypothetical protein
VHHVRILPVVLLVLLAPFIGELLLGSTPLHLAIAYPALLPLHVALYGSGALLARELVRRTGRGWPALLAMGIGYGLVEEGLGDMSLFNPTYDSRHLLDIAELFGVGWFWWLHVLTMHAVWSIGASIALTEALLPRRAHEPWLSRVGLAACAVTFLVSAAATHLVASRGYEPGPAQCATIIVLLGLVALFGFVPRRGERHVRGLAPSPLRTGAFAFATCSAFMLLHPRFTGASLPGGILVIADLLLYAAAAGMVWSWSGRYGWGPPQVLVLCAGAVLTYVWYGFVLVGGSPMDLGGQVVFSVSALLVLTLGSRRSQPASVVLDPRHLPIHRSGDAPATRAG